MQNLTRKAMPVLVIVLTAFGLRMMRLGYQPLWSDEIYSVAVARHSFSQVAGWVYRDNHPALYWFTLYPVVHLLGDGPLLVRFPSALMGTVTVALTYAAGKEVFNSRRIGLLAAVWLTVSPIHVVYSQEARMYAPLALFGMASTLFLHRGAFRGGGLNWILFGLTAAATAHSHNYGLLLVGAQGLWGLALLAAKREPRLLSGAALSLAAFLVVYGPMIPALMTQMGMSVGSTGVAGPRDVVDFLEAFGAGFTGFSTPGLTPGRMIRSTSLPSVAVTGVLAFLGLLVGRRESEIDASFLKFPSRWRSLLLGICTTLPVAFVYVYSSLSQKALWQVRGFQMALGCLALLIGAGLSFLRPRLLRWATCLGLVAVAAVNLHPHYFDRYKSTVPDAVDDLEGRLTSKDIFFVAPYWDWTPFRYYYEGTADAIGGRKQGHSFELAGVGTDYVDLVDPRSLEIQSEVTHPVIPVSRFNPDDYTRVWTISHWATPQRALEVFGDDSTIMHYDVEAQRWRKIVWPAPASSAQLPATAKSAALVWDNGLHMLGYRWQLPPVVGQKARLTLFWMSEQPSTGPLHLRVQLVDKRGKTALDHSSPLLSVMHGLPTTSVGIRSEFPTSAWPAGSVVAQDVKLGIPPHLPPIPYRLRLQVVDENDQKPVLVGGQSAGLLTEVSVARSAEPYGPGDVAVQHRRSVSFGGEIRLLGYDLPEASPRPGHHLPVWLHWSAETSPSADYRVELRLIDGKGTTVAETAGAPCDYAFPTSMWQQGDLARGSFTVPLRPDMKGDQYKLAVRLVDTETGEALRKKGIGNLGSREWVVVGRAEVLPWPLVTQAPKVEHRAEGEFGDAVRLLGYDRAGHPVPGREMKLTLYWMVETPLNESYQVFVHLTDEEGSLVAQADGIPVDWLRPTTTWREGEVIIDEHTLNLPSELAGGTYRLYTGFYQPGGPRLPVVVEGEPKSDGRMPLGLISVEPDE